MREAAERAQHRHCGLRQMAGVRIAFPGSFSANRFWLPKSALFLTRWLSFLSLYSHGSLRSRHAGWQKNSWMCDTCILIYVRIYVHINIYIHIYMNKYIGAHHRHCGLRGRHAERRQHSWKCDTYILIYMRIYIHINTYIHIDIAAYVAGTRSDDNTHGYARHIYI